MKKFIILIIFLFSLHAMAQRTTIQIPVLYSTDDADESVESNIWVSPGDMQLDNPELEMIYDDNLLRLCHVKSGMRFTDVMVPAGATICDAYIQFTCKQTTSDVVNLTINGQKSSNPSTFSTTTGDISTRPLTTASVNWDPAGWYSVDEAGADQRSPNLTSIVQEIVNGTGWTSGNSMVFIVSGTGASRTAYAYDGDQSKTAVLFIQYSGAGIEENKANLNPVISPNPSTDHFTLNINAASNRRIQFKILNQLGGEVHNFSYCSDNNGTYFFDITGMSSGFYYLNIITENSTITREITVIHSN